MNPITGALERELELAHIVSALDAAADGRGSAVVIEGPAGIGKTRLVQDTRAMAKARGFGRIQATGDELESAMAWSVVRQLIDRSNSRYGPEVRAQRLAGPSGAALTALGDAPVEAPAGDAALARTLHALWWVAADLSSLRPLLITVDDAQWADLASLHFLVYLSRRIADLPLALVISMRPAYDGSGPLAELSAGRGGRRILPRPLSQAAVATLCARQGVTPVVEVAAAIHAASGGNPFLAGLLVEELEARGIPLTDAGTVAVVTDLGPSAIFGALLGRLPQDAIAVASAAAVLGAHSEPGVAGAVAGFDQARLTAAIDALVVGHVLKTVDRKLAFVHPVIREAVLGQLRPGERTSLHAAAARTLYASAAPTNRIAAHLALSPTATLPDAAKLLREAAAGLLADGDAATAATHLSRALAEAPDDAELRGELGHALLRTGDAGQAREHLRTAAQAAADLRQRAQRLAEVASATAVVDGPRAAIEELRATLDQWPASNSEEALVLEARLATMCSLLPDEGKRSAQRLQTFAGLPGQTSEERTLLALVAQRARYDVAPSHEVAALAERALGEGSYLQDVADGAEGLVGWVVATMALVAADATATATTEIALAKARVRKNGSPLEFAMVSMVAGWLSLRIGDITSADIETAAALAAVAHENETPALLAVCATATHLGVLAALERGERAAAATALADFDARFGNSPQVIPVTQLGDARALLSLASDEPARAYAEAIALGIEMNAAGHDTPTVAWRSIAARAALRLGQSGDARTLAEAQLELAQRWGARTDIGAALRLLAHVESERRTELLEEALTVIERSPGRLELARATVDLGEALRVAGRRKQAHDPLRRGAELAAECGSRILRQRAMDGLAALGERPRQLMFSGQESLTASERRVAQLAVAGRTNRDIAQELFVTPKTVENQLGRAYIKLGITGRRQLADALG